MRNALPAILVIIVYTNLLILAKGWVEDTKRLDLDGYVLGGCHRLIIQSCLA